MLNKRGHQFWMLLSVGVLGLALVVAASNKKKSIFTIFSGDDDEPYTVWILADKGRVKHLLFMEDDLVLMEHRTDGPIDLTLKNSSAPPIKVKIPHGRCAWIRADGTLTISEYKITYRQAKALDELLSNSAQEVIGALRKEKQPLLALRKKLSP